jgi:serine/threonine protein kinase
MKQNGKVHAVKEISKAKVTNYGKTKSMFREESIMQKYNDCQYIIKFHFTFQDEKNIYFLLNYAPNGSLARFINP